jgi:trans-aconitate methyltransferase
MSTFATLSARYQQRATLQQSASQTLFALLAIQPTEAVLDLGCGPGHLTCQIGVEQAVTLLANFKDG